MLSLGPSQRYFLYRNPADMRKSFDGLAGLVRKELGRNPLSGDVFVFTNRRRTHVKLLVTGPASCSSTNDWRRALSSCRPARIPG